MALYVRGPLAIQMAAMQKTISRQSPASPAVRPVVVKGPLMARLSANFSAGRGHGENLNQSGPNRSTGAGTQRLY
jgi:hypothetical protein